MKYRNDINSSRRKFLQQSATLLAGAFVAESCSSQLFGATAGGKKVAVNGHLWVYASKFPPDWDCTPALETVFADLSYAGIDGVELMENTLRHNNSVERITGFIKKYNLPVSGTSYGVNLNMWKADEHKKILDDVQLVVPRLAKLGGKTFGISVGDARRIKTEKELDAQADLLQKVLRVCTDNGVEANLHNHIYEVINGLHDLKGTLQRLPTIKLGPDINWLIRAGVNPVDFIQEYGKQIAYLHIRDQYANGQWTEYLGQGNTDFTAIAKALNDQKFRGDVAVELAFPADFSPVNLLKEDWRLSRQYVKKEFGW